MYTLKVNDLFLFTERACAFSAIAAMVHLMRIYATGYMSEVCCVFRYTVQVQGASSLRSL